MEQKEKLKIQMDMDDMTFGDLEDFEKATGLIMSDAVKTVTVKDESGRTVPDPDDPKGRPLKQVRMSARAMNGMMWLALRRDNPDMSFEDIRKMKMSDVDFEVQSSEAEEAEDPTQPAA